MQLLATDFENVVREIDDVGATSITLLREEDLLKLRLATDALPYIRQPETVGRGRVRQDLWVCESLDELAPLLVLRDALQSHLLGGLLRIVPDLFSVPLSLNNLAVQRYEAGSTGITPHRDGASRINLVCAVVVEGAARFAICDDREGNNPREISAPPGHVILMRAPGWRGGDLQPFHFVTDIRERRTIIGLRQRPIALLPAI